MSGHMPWFVAPDRKDLVFVPGVAQPMRCGSAERARLVAAAPKLLAALREGRRAIGDHFAPTDCYATGPLTGDDFRDLVQCPACNFIAMYDAAIAEATGEQP